MALGRRAKHHHPEPVARLLRFEATDGVALAGLLYEPRKSRNAPVVIYLHGTGGASIFESKRTNLLAQQLVERGIAFFPFNNRGAHLMRRLRARLGQRVRNVGGGMSHELIRDAVFDIDGAMRLLRSRGYSEFYLAGHSTGANKIAVYDSSKKRNIMRGYIFIAGGDDTGLLFDQLGARRFRSALERARAEIKDGRGDELVPKSLSTMPMSWRSFYDMANPNGDYNVFPFLEALGRARLSRRPLFRHLRRVRKPSLVVYGDSDEYCFDNVSRCVASMAKALGPKENFEFVIVEGADHGFSGREEELATLIADWITL